MEVEGKTSRRLAVCLALFLVTTTASFADFQIGMSGGPIHENDGGRWYGVRLLLTYSYSYTDTFYNFRVNDGLEFGPPRFARDP